MARTPLKHLKTDLAWAAGFFEGEGSIFLQRTKARNPLHCYLYLRICVVQTERAQLEKFKRMFGGAIYSRTVRGNRKLCWYWNLQGEAALEAYEAMEPYFVGQHKREQFARTMNEIECAEEVA